MTNSINCVNFQGKEACSNSKAEAARRSSTLLAVEKRWSSKGRAVRTGRASVGNGQTLRILPLVHAHEELTGMAFAPLLTHACVWRICTGGPCSARAARTSVKNGQMSVFCCVRGSWLEMLFVRRASLPALVAYTMLRSAASRLMHY